MKSTMIQVAPLVVLCGALLLFPTTTYAQWDDRSDEVWDEFDSGNNTTTWVLVGAGVALATAAVVYTVKKRHDEKDEEQSDREDEARSALSFPTQPTSAQTLAAAQRSLPIQLHAGFHPATRAPALGLSLRF